MQDFKFIRQSTCYNYFKLFMCKKRELCINILSIFISYYEMLSVKWFLCIEKWVVFMPEILTPSSFLSLSKIGVDYYKKSAAVSILPLPVFLYFFPIFPSHFYILSNLFYPSGSGSGSSSLLFSTWSLLLLLLLLLLSRLLISRSKDLWKILMFDL